MRPARGSRSIRPAPRPSTPGRSRSAPTSSCMRRPRCSTAIRTWSPASLAGAEPDAFWERLVAIRREAGRDPRAVRGLPADPRPAHAAPARRRPGPRAPWRWRSASSAHPQVARVLYPGPAAASRPRRRRPPDGGRLRLHAVDPGHRRRGRRRSRTAARVGLWKRATSLGGVESLIEHRASIEGPGTPCPPDLLRLSTGIEDPDDLFRDLDEALTAAALGTLWLSASSSPVARRQTRPTTVRRTVRCHDAITRRRALQTGAAAAAAAAPPRAAPRGRARVVKLRDPGDHRSPRERLPLRLLPRRGRRHGRASPGRPPSSRRPARRRRTASCSTTAT